MVQWSQVTQEKRPLSFRPELTKGKYLYLV